MMPKNTQNALDIDITIEVSGWPEREVLCELVRKICDVVFSHLGFDGVESDLSLLFTDDAHMQDINRKWRGQDKPTNVLSFPAFALVPGEAPKSMMGDIVLAFETLVREAKQEKKDFNHHLSHLLVHGLLHLLGYDHETIEEADMMEGYEVVILRALAIPNPYQYEEDIVSARKNP